MVVILERAYFAIVDCAVRPADSQVHVLRNVLGSQLNQTINDRFQIIRPFINAQLFVG